MNLIDIKDGKFMGVWDEEQGRRTSNLLGVFIQVGETMPLEDLCITKLVRAL